MDNYIEQDISNLFTYYRPTSTSTSKKDTAPVVFSLPTAAVEDPLLETSSSERPSTTSGKNWYDKYRLTTPLTTGSSAPTATTATMSANRNVKFMGKDINLQHAVDIITQNQAITAGKAEFLHTCTRHVTNALKGETNPRKAGGLANPKAMYNQLVKDGWTDVLDNNYTPQVGDVYTVWGVKGGKYGMHSSMWNGSQWLSYNADNHGKSTPWYFNQRGKAGVQMHIMRYGTPSHRLGGKLSLLKSGGVIKMEQGSIFSIYNDANNGLDDTDSYETTDNPPVSFALPNVDVPPAETPLDRLVQTMDRRARQTVGNWYSQYQLPEVKITAPYPSKSSVASSGYTADKGKFSGDQQEFVRTMYPLIKAKLDTIGKGSFAPVVVAHMSIESAWGTKPSGKFNYAGMMATKNEPGTMCNTFEYVNGQKVNTRSKFKDFKDVNDFIDFYINRLNGKFKAFEGPNYAANIRAHGYYTAPLELYQKAIDDRLKAVSKYI